jgi:hypothetical protein
MRTPPYLSLALPALYVLLASPEEKAPHVGIHTAWFSELSSQVPFAYSSIAQPDTAIISAPANPTNNPRATFAFVGSGGVVAFDCSLDGSPYPDCVSPWTSPNLSEGFHGFQVRARDGGGNVDPTPDSYAWVVDLTPPDTVITEQPSNPTNSSSATFTFASAGGGFGFDCALTSNSGQTTSYPDCVSPATFPTPSDGSYGFQVRAKDAAGNTDPTPASYGWFVDLTPPDTVLTGKPTNPTNNSSATFTFASTGGGFGFDCALTSNSGQTTSYPDCVSPMAVSNLSDGSYTFQIRAKDAVGNVDPSPASYNWNVDTTPPDTSIDVRPPSVTNQPNATFAMSSPSTDVAGFDCSLDGANFTPCVSPASLTNLANGTHVLAARARDQAGNVDPTPANYAWQIDLTAPETMIEAGPQAATNSTNAIFILASSDPNLSGFECSLDEASFTACTSPLTLKGLVDGNHQLRVRAHDSAGNIEPGSASYLWAVDTNAPLAPQILSPAADSLLSDITPVVTGTAEAGTTVMIYVDTHEMGTIVASSGNWELPLQGEFAAGSHSLTATSTDAAGNTSPTSDAVRFVIEAKGYYGWGCSTSSPASVATWLLALLILPFFRARVPRQPHGLSGLPSSHGIRGRGLWCLASLLFWLSGTASGSEPAHTAVPRTKNPHFRNIARLYDSLEYEAALESLRKAEAFPGNGPRELIWLDLMKGILHHGLKQSQEADDAFRSALAKDSSTQLPITEPSRTLRERFEQLRQEALQARAALPTQGKPPTPGDGPAPPKTTPPSSATTATPAPMLASPTAVPASTPSPTVSSTTQSPLPQRDSSAWSLTVGIRGEADLKTPGFTPAISVGATRSGIARFPDVRLGGVLTAIVQPNPGIRLEGRIHPHDLLVSEASFFRPHLALGATTFFPDVGVGGRVAAGLSFHRGTFIISTEAAYERFFNPSPPHSPNAMLISLGIGWAPFSAPVPQRLN